ncbi:LPXTG cell wall anchor domain-containing protein [Arcanobacterium haemolyticum]|uniref:LPXTG cell wall anchor domain-containing protein n=1 Tax=Arcanobacterium haemolyticum TaxID=28264 RepID=UPI002160C80E|nr:LPXTG cell wall anchor domain-containing protein [Arcanobacterium haemolyticum]
MGFFEFEEDTQPGMNGSAKGDLTFEEDTQVPPVTPEIPEAPKPASPATKELPKTGAAISFAAGLAASLLVVGFGALRIRRKS